jgi:hypothetical protein
MVIGEAVLLAVMSWGEEVTVYEVIGEPPSDADSLNETVALALPPIAVPMIGASGTACGVTPFEGAEAELSPKEFVATTVNV